MSILDIFNKKKCKRTYDIPMKDIKPKQIYTITQSSTPDTLYPILSSKKELYNINQNTIYSGKIAIVNKPSVVVVNTDKSIPDNSISLFDYLMELNNNNTNIDELINMAIDLKFLNEECRDTDNRNDFELIVKIMKSCIIMNYNDTDSFCYFMYVNDDWELLKSCPLKFEESNIKIFIDKSKIHSIKQYEIVYTIQDDSYWVNICDNESQLLLMYIGTRQKLGKLNSNMVDFDNFINTYKLSSIVGVKTTISDDYYSYILYTFDKNNFTYNKCNTATVDVYEEE